MEDMQDVFTAEEICAQATRNMAALSLLLLT